MGVEDDRKCCQQMSIQIQHTCEQHPDETCPDQVVIYNARFDEYSIPIRDGGGSSIVIQYCPWCGRKLPESKRDAWFDQIESIGVDVDGELPSELKTDKWWRMASESQNNNRRRPSGDWFSVTSTAAKEWRCVALI